MKKHPMQPIVEDEYKTLRFKENKIVSKLLDFASERGYDMNQIAMGDFSKEDRQQFAQLIGYSVCGYSDLSYSEPNAYEIATVMHEDGETEQEAKLKYYENLVADLKEQLKEPISNLFNIHPEDLEYLGE